MSDSFGYQDAAKRTGIQADQLSRLEACLRRQYGSDEMLFSLRMLRTLKAIAEGATTVDEAIREFAGDTAGVAMSQR